MRNYDTNDLSQIYLSHHKPISNLFLTLGITTFREALKYVHELPYGRNNNSTDYLSAISEKCGTCSTKHALIYELSFECEVAMTLHIAVFMMSKVNTPKISAVLNEYNLLQIPEMHCYLRYKNRIIDITFPENSASLELTEEEKIEPEHLGNYKVEKHGYEVKIAQKFEDIFISHITQTDESDMNFLRRIGDEYEATVKPVGKCIIFIPKGGGKSATEKVLGITVLTPKVVINWKVNFNVRSKYGSVIAKWYSYERGETIEEKVGNEEPSYPIYKLYPTAESAISAASAKLRRLKQNEAKLNVTIPGNPELFAEAKINLSGFCQEIDGEWVIERAERILDNRGYQTMIEAVISRVN